MRFALDRLVLVDRPATTPKDAPVGTVGDTIEVYCVGGPVMVVDPETMKTTSSVKRFKVVREGVLAP